MENKCEECRYGVEFKREIEGGEARFIECRRYPTQFSMMPGPQGQMMGQWAFPVLNPNAWCGEFAPKEDNA